MFGKFNFFIELLLLLFFKSLSVTLFHLSLSSFAVLNLTVQIYFMYEQFTIIWLLTTTIIKKSNTILRTCRTHKNNCVSCIYLLLQISVWWRLLIPVAERFLSDIVMIYNLWVMRQYCLYTVRKCISFRSHKSKIKNSLILTFIHNYIYFYLYVLLYYYYY